MENGMMINQGKDLCLTLVQDQKAEIRFYFTKASFQPLFLELVQILEY